MADLLALAERIEKEPASDELDRAVCDALGLDYMCDENGAFGGYGVLGPSRRFTTSLDAVKALERGRLVAVMGNDQGCRVNTSALCGPFTADGSANGDHAEPRARLAAILRAKAGEA